MKRFCLFFATMLSMLPLFSMSGSISESLPNQFVVSWQPVEGATYYDVYIDRAPYDRLSAKTLSIVVGSDYRPLSDDQEYEILVAARDLENHDLDHLVLNGKTTSWDGTYSWTNPSDKNNKGRCTGFALKVQQQGEQKQFTLILDGKEEVISPIPVSSVLCPIDDGTPTASALLAMVGMFNTTDYPIDQYRIISTAQDDEGLSINLETVCKGYHLNITFTVRYSADSGVPSLKVSCNAKGIYDMVIFKNPEKGSKGIFTLTSN